VIGDGLYSAEFGHDLLQIPSVSEDNSGHEEVEAGGAVLLILVCAVANFA
jgi:hypothetical protein